MLAFGRFNNNPKLMSPINIDYERLWKSFMQSVRLTALPGWSEWPGSAFWPKDPLFRLTLSKGVMSPGRLSMSSSASWGQASCALPRGISLPLPSQCEWNTFCVKSFSLCKLMLWSLEKNGSGILLTLQLTSKQCLKMSHILFLSVLIKPFK